MRLLLWLLGRLFGKKGGLDEKKLVELEERLAFGAKLDKKPVARQYLAYVKIAAREMVVRLTDLRDNWFLNYERRMGFPPPPSIKAPVEDFASKRRTVFLRVIQAFSGSADLLVGYIAGPVWINARFALFAHLGGLLVAVFTVFLFMGVWGLGHRDHSNPTPSLRRRERLLWVVAFFACALILSLTVERFLNLPAALLKVLLGASCAALSMLAAGSHVLADEVDGLNRLVREYRAVQSEYRRLQVLIVRMEDVLEPGELEQSLKFERELQRIEAEEEVHHDA